MLPLDHLILLLGNCQHAGEARSSVVKNSAFLFTRTGQRKDRRQEDVSSLERKPRNHFYPPHLVVSELELKE